MPAHVAGRQWQLLGYYVALSHPKSNGKWVLFDRYCHQCKHYFKIIKKLLIFFFFNLKDRLFDLFRLPQLCCSALQQ